MLGTKINKNKFDKRLYAECANFCNNNQEYRILDRGDYYEVAYADLEEIKEQKIADFKFARDKEELSPIEFNGYLWDFDDKAQQRINGAIIALGDNTITWTSADNESIENVTTTDLMGVIGSAAIRSNILHIKYRQLKEQIEQANTLEELNAIKW